MKKLLILGTLLLSSCSAYRIQISTTTAGTYYHSSQRVGVQWVEHYSTFTLQQQAEEQIREWKEEKVFAKNNKSQYIYFK
jgi:hypothetical protein